jgi:Cu/Zn superoxide dismutase
MKIPISALATVCALGLSASAAIAPASAAKPVQIHLVAQNASGETGTVTMLDGPLGLIVHVRVNETTLAQPAHIHKGTCAKLDPKPAFPLTTIADGQSQSTIPGATVAQVTAQPYAVNVHKSTKDVATYVACANIVM